MGEGLGLFLFVLSLGAWWYLLDLTVKAVERIKPSMDAVIQGLEDHIAEHHAEGRAADPYEVARAKLFKTPDRGQVKGGE